MGASIFTQLYSRPYLLLSLAALFWSGNVIVGRLLREYVGPIDLNLMRWLIALSIMLPFTWRLLRRESTIIMQNKWFILLLGILGVAAFQSLTYLSLQTTTAINALLLISTCPVLIVAGNIVFYREWVGWTVFTGVLLSFMGTLVLISHGNISTFYQLAFFPGDLWMLLASLTWAAYSVLLKNKPTSLSQFSMLVSSVVAGVVILSLLSLVDSTANSGDYHPWDRTFYLSLLYLGLFPSVLAFICWNRGVELVGANKAGVFLHLMPVFGALLSFFLLGEALEPFHLTGAILVFSGIALTSRRSAVA